MVLLPDNPLFGVLIPFQKYMADPEFDIDGLHALCVYWALAACQAEVRGLSYEYCGLHAPRLSLGWANRTSGAFPTQTWSFSKPDGASLTFNLRAMTMDTRLIMYAWIASAPDQRRTLTLRCASVSELHRDALLFG